MNQPLARVKTIKTLKQLFNPTSEITLIFLLIPIIFLHAQDLGNFATQKPFQISGNLSAQTLFYDAEGIEPRSKPFSYILTGNLNTSIYGVDVPLSFVWSEQERDFRQPFNQFGISPHYKWATFHIGYSNMNFSSFTLGGYNILGAGVELNPGKFRFGFIYGRFNRATSSSDIGEANPTPSYKRMGFAGKIGYGTDKSFFDLIVLKAKDDSTSLKPDSANQFLTPSENIVIGYNSKISFTKKLFFESEAALSIFTKDITAPKNSENASFPVRLFSGILTPNSTTNSNTAISAAIGYKEKFYSAKIQYKRISADYTSMGTYYTNNDLQNFTFEPSCSLLKQKLNFHGALGLQNDNLNNDKDATSLRTIGSLALSYNPFTQFGIDASFSNLSMSQKAGKLPLIDSTKILQSNMNITVMPRIIFANQNRIHIILLSYNYVELNDKNQYTDSLTNYNTTNIFINYILSLVKSSLSISLGINSTTVKMTAGTSTSLGFSVSLSKSLLENHLTLAMPVTVQNSKFQNNNSWVINFTPGLTYRLNKKHQFLINIGYIGNFSYEAGQTFNEFRGNIGYTYTF